MKLNTIIIGLLCLSAFGCKEQELETTPLASISITNVVQGGATLTFNTSTQTVANQNFANLAVKAGESKVRLYTNTSPQVTYYDQTMTTTGNEYYSLFLGGASATAVDALLVKDSYKNYTDSLFGVRFVNLLPGGPAIKVNLLSQATGSEVSSLAYKTVSPIKTYNADYKPSSNTYMFEIRNATTDAIILSYGFRPTALTTPVSLPANPIPRFKNVSLVLKGTVASPSILRVNHY